MKIYLIMLGVAIFVTGLATKLRDEKIKKLEEEVKHVKYNHKRELDRNLELINQNQIVRKQYNDMVAECLRLNRELKKAMIK